MQVTGWKQFEDNVRATVGGPDVKVYHSFTDHGRVKVDNDSVFEEAVKCGLMLSVWICQPGHPSPPLRVDTSSPVVAQHRHVPPSTTPPRMAPLTTPPSTSRVGSVTPSSTPSSRRNQQRKSPSVSSSPGSSSPVSSHEKTMGNRVKRRDGVCVFTHVVPLTGENHNCHILAASPLERRIDGRWWESHRERMIGDGYDGHLDQYVMTMDDYEAKKAPRGFQRPEGGLSHIIALPSWGGRENDEIQYVTSLGLYAHNQFNAALGKGRVKLEIVEHNDRDEGDFVDFKVRWSIAPPLWEKHFKGRGIQTGYDEQEKPIFIPYPDQGWLKQPPTEEGQRQWPDRVVFELYSEVWYPFCRWNDEKDEKNA